MKENKILVLLVHGFFRNDKDMEVLKTYLGDYGQDVYSVNLPTTFQPLEKIYTSFKKQLLDIDTNIYTKIHFVGHSMGGLIIRYYLSKHKVPKLGRCVFIGTPNKGTRLADIGLKIPLLAQVLKPIRALHSKALAIDLPQNNPTPDIGIIAGTNHRLITGCFLKKPNDGRVEVAANKLDVSLMKDFIALDYVHTKIHKEKITAELVYQFLEYGKFKA
jgi:pimeloyl-ACP methyl ester carboxylesterase